MVGAGELDHDLAAGDGARQADRAHRRLGPGAGHPHHLDRREARRRPPRPAATSAAVAAPKLVPRFGRLDHRRDHRRLGVAEDQRAPGADPVEVAVAVDVEQLAALAALDEDRVAADLPHRPHRRVDAARQHSLRPLKQVGHPLQPFLSVAEDRQGTADAHECSASQRGVVVGEVVEADLLVLGRGVEGGAVVGADPALLGDRVEDRVALLLRAAVGHREDAVGPVLVGRPLVAVGDAAEGGHAAADLEDLLLGHLPDAHPVGREAGAAVVEDRRDPAQDLAVDHPAQAVEQLLGRDPELGGGLVVGSLDRAPSAPAGP